MVSVSIEKDENNKSKGFGFVDMKNHEDAKNAVEKLNGSKIKGLSDLLLLIALQL